MTTEDDFQAVLDAHPDDHDTRRIFADRLEERGDARAEGYRALGKRRHWPKESYFSTPTQMRGYSLPENDQAVRKWPHAILPPDWFALIEGAALKNEFWCWFVYRASADNFAALAFTKLPAERRAELLAAAPS